MRSKSWTGTGVGSSHSADFACHGFSSAGSRLNTSDHTTLTRNTSIEIPSTNADAETQSFSAWNVVGYVTTRRGIPMKPSPNSGAKVELNARNITQKWTFARRSLNLKPYIFGTQ